MSYLKIIKKTYRTFFVSTSIATMGLAVTSLLNTIIAGIAFGSNGSYVVGLALPIMLFADIITYFFGVGGGIAASIRLGKGEKQQANEILTFSVFSIVVLGLIVAVIGKLFTVQLLPILGAQTAEQQEIVQDYVSILLIGTPGILVSKVLNIFIRNDGHPKVAMAGVILAVVANFALLGILIGLLHYSVAAIAVATVVSNLFSALFYLGFYFAKKSTIRIQKSIRFGSIKDIFKPGFSGSMIFFAQMILTVYINQILLRVSGSDGIAAYGVVKCIVSFIYAYYDSVNLAAQPMLSVYHGEHDGDSIRLTSKVSSIYLAIGVAVLCVTLWFTAPLFSQLYNINITEALRFIGISSLFSCVVTFLNNSYRATGKANLTLLYIILDNLVLPAVIVTVLVFGFHMDDTGVWTALLAADALTLAIMLVAMHKNILQIPKDEVPKEKKYFALISNHEADIVALNSGIESFCEQNDIDMKKQYYIMLCIEEIAVNIIEHGFQDGKEHYIDIRIIAGDRLLLNIRDDATAYDPTAQKDADITASAEEFDTDGLGIFLVKKVAKEFSYRRVIGFNNLHIVL